MTDRVLLTGDDLEDALRDLGRHLAWPSTPDLAQSVRLEVAGRPASSPRRTVGWSWLRSPLAAILLMLVVVGAALLAGSPEARRAVAERLGLRGFAITEVESIPTVMLAPLNLGRPTSLAEAGLPLDIGALGQPLEVYIGPRNEVWLVYASPESGARLLLTVVRGLVEAEMFGKLLGPGSSLEQLTVNGGRGFWISGAPHTFFYRDAQAVVREEPMRLAGNTLLWEQSNLTLRLEGAFSRDEALRVASRVR